MATTSTSKATTTAKPTTASSTPTQMTPQQQVASGYTYNIYTGERLTPSTPTNSGGSVGTASTPSGIVRANPNGSYSVTGSTEDIPAGYTFPGQAQNTAQQSPKTPAPTPAQAPQPQNYTVAEGDTLSKIAANNGTSIQAIMSANPAVTNPNQIKTGQTLVIPNAKPGNVVAPGDKVNATQNAIYGKIQGVTDLNKVGAVRAAANGAVTDLNVGTTSNVSEAVTSQVDPLIAQFSQQINEYLKPDNQKETLTQEYNRLKSELGIDSINTDLINVKNVMAGTEDDIRAEVTKANGFATESQVQALTVSRNKVLLKKATFLQDQLDSAKDTLNTTLTLDEKDRQMASDRFNTAIGLEEKLITIQNDMHKSAVQNYQTLIDNVGYNGMAKMMDPFSRRLAETTLGLPQGFLDKPPLTAKQVSEQLAQKRFEVSEANAERRFNIQMKAQERADKLAKARILSYNSGVVNKTINELFPSGKNPIQTYNNSSQAINRIDESYKIATDPKNKSKGAADLDLVDAYVQIARGGQSITEAQVDTLFKSLGVSAKFDVASQKVTGTALLDNSTRKQISNLSHNIFDGQYKLAQQGVNSINSRLTKLGVDDSLLFDSPDEVIATQSYTTGSNVTVKDSSGKMYSLPADQLQDAISQGYSLVNQ